MITIENLQLTLNELDGTKGIGIVHNPTDGGDFEVLHVFKGKLKAYIVFGDIGGSQSTLPRELDNDEIVELVKPYLANCTVRVEQ